MSFRGNAFSPSWVVTDQDLIVRFVGWSIVNSMVALYHSGIQSLSGEICPFPPFLDVIRMAFVCLSVGGFSDAIMYVCSASLSKDAWIKVFDFRLMSISNGLFHPNSSLLSSFRIRL